MQKPRFILRFLAWALAVPAALAAAGCTPRRAPTAQFVAQADRLHQAIGAATADDSLLEKYFRRLGGRVIQAAREAEPQRAQNPIFADVQFHLVDCDTVNAFTTGGRHVYVYNGVFQLCETEDDLAAVIAHQFAHAIWLDAQETGMKPGKGVSDSRFVYGFVERPFTPGQERRAARTAFDIYSRGGWDPARFTALPERLRAGGLAAVHSGAFASGAKGGGGRPHTADDRTFQQLRARAQQRAEAPRPPELVQMYLRAFPNCVLTADQPEQVQAQKALRKRVYPPEENVVGPV